MRSTFTAMALALAAMASPAAAQYANPPASSSSAGPPSMGPAPAGPAVAAVPAEPQLCPTTISKGARKPLIALQTALDAKDAAGFAAADVVAHAAASTPEDRCVLAQLELNFAGGRGDFGGVATALDAVATSGVGNQARLVALTDQLGKLRFNAKDYVGAATAFERATRLAPNDGDQYILLGETRAKTGQTDAALTLYRKAIAVQAAAGGKVKEDYLKHAVALAYDSKNPQAFDLARAWVAAYPSPKNWRDALKIYSNLSAISGGDLIDVYRLQRATHSLAGEADFGHYAEVALAKGLIGEAVGELDEGISANAISATSPAIKTIRAQGAGKVAADRASLSGAATKALAGSLAKPAQVTADALYGYGDYAKAATLYRAALGKSGGDASEINLRLGSALTMSGDKAGAKAAFDLVTGPRAEVAKYWLIYLAQRP